MVVKNTQCNFGYEIFTKNPKYQREIDLTEKLLMSRTETQVENQGRNFHCWDHRRLILTKNPTLEDQPTELALTTRLISTSFSNFSAWHYRSKLLADELEKIENSKREMEMALNAIFTDPADQSSWIYHRWLISTIPQNKGKTY